MSFLPVVIMSVVWMLLCGRLAEKRGRSVKLWRPLGFMFGLVALITLALMPKKAVGDDTAVMSEPALVQRAA